MGTIRAFRTAAAVALMNLGVVGGAEPEPLTVIRPRGDEQAYLPQWMSFSPEGKVLAVRHATLKGQDGRLSVYDSSSGGLVNSVPVRGSDRPVSPVSHNCAFSRGSDWIAYGEGNEIRFLAIPPHKPVLPGGGTVRVSEPPVAGPVRVWLDRTGDSLLVDRSTSGSPVMELRSLTMGARSGVLPILKLVADPVALAVSPSASRYAVALQDGEKTSVVCVRWAGQGSQVTIAAPDNLRPSALTFSSDGKLVVGRVDGSVSLVDADSGKEIRYIRPLGQQRGVGALESHPGGKYFACGTHDQMGLPNLFVVETASGIVTARWVANRGGVTAVCFNSTGDRLATTGLDGTVNIWDTTNLLVGRK